MLGIYLYQHKSKYKFQIIKYVKYLNFLNLETNECFAKVWMIYFLRKLIWFSFQRVSKENTGTFGSFGPLRLYSTKMPPLISSLKHWIFPFIIFITWVFTKIVGIADRTKIWSHSWRRPLSAYWNDCGIGRKCIVYFWTEPKIGMEEWQKEYDWLVFNKIFHKTTELFLV